MTEAPPTCPKCGEPMEPSPPRAAVLHHFLDAEPDEKAFAGGWACTECGWEVEDEQETEE